MFLSDIFGSAIDKVVDSVGESLDKIFTSDEERLLAQNELQKIRQAGRRDVIKLSNEYEKTITKRWQSDNEHFITRLVRPLVVIFLYCLFGVMALMDGNVGEFSINSAYIPVIQTLLVTVTVAYFGSRGIEKATKIYKG